MLLPVTVSLSLVASAWASVIGVDLEVQQLFNSSGTDYPTTFTRDVVPVILPPMINVIERDPLS
jgi:hypothetical protein